jgi:4-diphosphocytidyl-2-C-methyl-D-erythritol kinase
MNAVTVRVPAKVNLQFAVGSRGADGFHDLVTVFQAVSLYDEVSVTPADMLQVSVTGDSRIGAPAVPCDPTNLAARAAIALAAYTGRAPTVSIRIRKHIPVAGGMAGGSADAAATLVACDLLWETGCSRAELSAIAADLGSDVPFMLHGGTAVGRGRGHLLEPMVSSGPFHWVIAGTNRGLLTVDVYGAHSRFRAAARGRVAALPDGPTDGLRDALVTGDPKALAAEMYTDLQATALRLRPQLGRLLDFGVEQGALRGLISGTGPSCAFLVASADEARRLQGRLETFEGCTRALTVYGPVGGIEVVASPVKEVCQR